MNPWARNNNLLEVLFGSTRWWSTASCCLGGRVNQSFPGVLFGSKQLISELSIHYKTYDSSPPCKVNVLHVCADLYETNNTSNDRFSLLNFFMSWCGRLYFPVMASVNPSHMHFLHDDFDAAHWKLESTFLLWVKSFLQKLICWGPDLQNFRTCLYLEIGSRGCQVQMKSLGVTIGKRLVVFLEPGFLTKANQDVREWRESLWLKYF